MTHGLSATLDFVRARGRALMLAARIDEALVGHEVPPLSLSRPAPPPLGTVLIADDEPGALRLIAAWLTAAGQTFYIAPTIGDALLALARGGVGRVILDWRWPDGAPMTVVMLCRAQGIPLVIYTGFADTSIPADLYVIQKPGLEELRAWLGLTPAPSANARAGELRLTIEVDPAGEASIVRRLLECEALDPSRPAVLTIKESAIGALPGSEPDIRCALTPGTRLSRTLTTEGPWRVAQLTFSGGKLSLEHRCRIPGALEPDANGARAAALEYSSWGAHAAYLPIPVGRMVLDVVLAEVPAEWEPRTWTGNGAMRAGASTLRGAGVAFAAQAGHARLEVANPAQGSSFAVAWRPQVTAQRGEAA